jgi:hypothetical protein
MVTGDTVIRRFAGFVIARSVSDEAIQGRKASLDCFASLAMTSLCGDASGPEQQL